MVPRHGAAKPKVNSLDGSMSVQAKYYGSDRRWYMYMNMRSSSGLSMLRASINSWQVRVNLLRLVLGRNVNGNTVKMLL